MRRRLRDCVRVGEADTSMWRELHLDRLPECVSVCRRRIGDKSVDKLLVGMGRLKVRFVESSTIGQASYRRDAAKGELYLRDCCGHRSRHRQSRSS